MNRKIIAWVSLVVVALILLLWAVIRLSPVGHSPGVVSDVLGMLMTVLALPMRWYVVLVLGENGSWSLPVLVLLLALSGLMWGIITERVVWIIRRLRTV